MVDKKKCLFGLKFVFLLLFIMFLGTFSTCYANVTSDYVRYLMESVANYGTIANNSAQNKQNVLNQIENVNAITTELNNRLANHNWQTLNNYSLIGTFQSSSSSIKLIFIFSNCSAPNSTSDVGYLSQRGNYFGTYNSGRCLFVYATITNSISYSEDWTTGTNVYFDYVDKINNSDFTTVKYTNVFNYVPSQVIYTTNAYNQLTGQLLNDTRGTYANNPFTTPTPIPTPPPTPEPTPTPEPAQVIISKIDDVNNNISNQGQKITDAISGEGQAIRDTISGETDKIINFLSGDVDWRVQIMTAEGIYDSLNVDFASNPYAPFWLELTTGLSNALLGSNRTIDVAFRNYHRTINLNEISGHIPGPIGLFLGTASTTIVVFFMCKWWKLIIDYISSGGMDEAIHMVEEEGIINLF